MRIERLVMDIRLGLLLEVSMMTVHVYMFKSNLRVWRFCVQDVYFNTEPEGAPHESRKVRSVEIL